MGFLSNLEASFVPLVAPALGQSRIRQMERILLVRFGEGVSPWREKDERSFLLRTGRLGLIAPTLRLW